MRVIFMAAFLAAASAVASLVAFADATGEPSAVEALPAVCPTIVADDYVPIQGGGGLRGGRLLIVVGKTKSLGHDNHGARSRSLEVEKAA